MLILLLPFLCLFVNTLLLFYCQLLLVISISSHSAFPFSSVPPYARSSPNRLKASFRMILLVLIKSFLRSTDVVRPGSAKYFILSRDPRSSSSINSWMKARCFIRQLDRWAQVSLGVSDLIRQGCSRRIRRFDSSPGVDYGPVRFICLCKWWCFCVWLFEFLRTLQYSSYSWIKNINSRLFARQFCSNCSLPPYLLIGRKGGYPCDVIRSLVCLNRRAAIELRVWYLGF